MTEFEWKTPAYFNHTTSPALAQHYSAIPRRHMDSF